MTVPLVVTAVRAWNLVRTVEIPRIWGAWWMHVKCLGKGKGVSSSNTLETRSFLHKFIHESNLISFNNFNSATFIAEFNPWSFNSRDQISKSYKEQVKQYCLTRAVYIFKKNYTLFKPMKKTLHTTETSDKVPDEVLERWLHDLIRIHVSCIPVGWDIYVT